MLRELHIENVAVIERADLELGPGLNILTGETGAGKSILVDAMHAILGARASRELVRTGAEKAVVCATFDPDPCQAWCEENEIECDDELIIRRQITSEGKTSCRVCGVPVTTAQLRTLGALLLDIHGQNDGQHLLDEREHLRNLDRFGQLEPELARYREQFRAYQALCRERDTLSTYENEKELLTESLRRQIEELERAELKAGEEAELTERSDLLRNFEKLSEAVDQAYDLLAGRDDSASALAGEALSEVERAASYAGELASLPEAVKSAVFTLQDAAETLRDFRDGLDFSDEEFDRIETRLSIAGISKLQTEAATITPAAKPVSERCTASLSAFFIKNTHAAPSAVPRNGIRIPQNVCIRQLPFCYGSGCFRKLDSSNQQASYQRTSTFASGNPRPVKIHDFQPVSGAPQLKNGAAVRPPRCICIFISRPHQRRLPVRRFPPCRAGCGAAASCRADG